ncbi:MAG: M90 family metallopeptidase [Isosphaeraceae bacterium]
MFGYLKRRRRRRYKSSPFPPSWGDIVANNVPIFHRLPQDDRRELEGHIQVFLAEKHFEGCGGLDLSEEIKVTVAAHACVLLLHRDTDYFPRLITILVYPAAYRANAAESLGDGLVLEGEQIRLGEAWKGGVVVLSWKELRAMARGTTPGWNLVLHEFAHLLDLEDGRLDGTPLLESRSQLSSWAKTFEWEFERLKRDESLGRYTVLDKYGASNPAEFFAVATEAFFEKSLVLERRHPELYRELKSFYRQDPARWGGNPNPPLLVVADEPNDD